MYALIDCNNFYVSCERVFNPALRDKPVAVLSNNDGCVVARSNEVKKMGIPMGAPYFKYKTQLTAAGACIFSSNYDLYGDMSRRVMEVLSSFGTHIEIYSIDEAFMTFAGFNEADLLSLASTIRQTVLQHVGIPVSIGFGETKTLAKVASHKAKKDLEHNGVFCIGSENMRQSVLETFDIGDVWGVGRQYKRRLHECGVQTAGEFLRLKPHWVKREMSIVGLRTWQELQGQVCDTIQDKVPAKKSIASTRSFGHAVTSHQELKEAIAQYVTRASLKLRKQQSVAHYIDVFVMTNRFHSDRYYKSLGMRLSIGTSYTPEILRAAHSLLERVFVAGKQYKKAGILLSGITPDTMVQRSLFDDSVDREKQARVMQAVDKVNKLYGKSSLQVGSAVHLGDTKAKWAMSSEYRSKRFTTEWGEVLTVGN